MSGVAARLPLHMPDNLPLPLTWAESRELKVLLRTAVDDAISEFMRRTVVTAPGSIVAVQGPHPDSVNRETGFHLARIVCDFGLDIFNVSEHDRRLAALEAELVHEGSEVEKPSKAFAATARPPAAASRAPRQSRKP